MMIRIEEGNNSFNYRIVGVAVHKNSVFLQQAEGDDFWVLPGGRAEFGETAGQTLERELREETGVQVEVVRLLWLVENFFRYEGKHCHELSLYFFMRLPAACKYLIEPGPFKSEGEDGTKLTFQWFLQQPEVLSTCRCCLPFCKLQCKSCQTPSSTLLLR